MIKTLKKHPLPFLFLFMVCVILNTGCEAVSENKTLKEYIHLAHIRTWDTINQSIDPRVEQMDLSNFDMILLGGDLTEESSKEKKTLDYLDAIFDLDSPNTLWALGNHDNENLNWVEEKTTRPYFFTHYSDGITYVVLYTQENIDWVCTITGDQLKMLENVTDTISESSHLVVMTHKLIWILNHPELSAHQGTSAYDWSCNYQIHENGWMDDILPRLQAVQNRGVQVIALAGDIGNNVSTFEEQTKDGIYYLASGSNPDKKDAKFLKFEHDTLNKTLDWEFIEIEAYLKNQ